MSISSFINEVFSSSARAEKNLQKLNKIQEELRYHQENQRKRGGSTVGDSKTENLTQDIFQAARSTAYHNPVEAVIVFNRLFGNESHGNTDHINSRMKYTRFQSAIVQATSDALNSPHWPNNKIRDNSLFCHFFEAADYGKQPDFMVGIVTQIRRLQNRRNLG